MLVVRPFLRVAVRDPPGPQGCEIMGPRHPKVTCTPCAPTGACPRGLSKSRAYEELLPDPIKNKSCSFQFTSFAAVPAVCLKTSVDNPPCLFSTRSNMADTKDVPDNKAVGEPMIDTTKWKIPV